MMYLNWKSADGRTRCDTWHIGEPVPERGGHVLESIQADGDELDTIKRVIAGIPTSTARVCIWRAPFADFIRDNISIHHNRGSE